VVENSATTTGTQEEEEHFTVEDLEDRFNIYITTQQLTYLQ